MHAVTQRQGLVQASDTEAAEAALRPAWIALQAGEHKVPPTPPRPLAANPPATTPLPPGCTVSGCSGLSPPAQDPAQDPTPDPAWRGRPGRRRASAEARGCLHENSLGGGRWCSSGAGKGPGGVCISPFSASDATDSAGCMSRNTLPCPTPCSPSSAGGVPPTVDSRGRCGSGFTYPVGSSRAGHGGGGPAEDLVAGQSSGTGADGFRTPPRTRSWAGGGGRPYARPTGRQGSASPAQVSSAAGCGGGRGSPGAAAGAGCQAVCAAAGGGSLADASFSEDNAPGGAHCMDAAGQSNGDVGGGARAAGEWPAAPFLRRFSAAWVYVSMATAGVALRERQRRYAEAADLLRLLLGAPGWHFHGPGKPADCACDPPHLTRTHSPPADPAPVWPI